MTSSAKNKIYVDYYNMAKDWDTPMLIRQHRQCCKFRDDIQLHQRDIYFEINNIQDHAVCDILYARDSSLFPDADDFVPYCVVLGLDKVINYGI